MFTFQLCKSNNSFHSKANVIESKNNGSLQTFNIKKKKKRESVQLMYTKIDEFQIIKLTKNKTHTHKKKNTFKFSLVHLLEHGANNARGHGFNSQETHRGEKYLLVASKLTVNPLSLQQVMKTVGEPIKRKG